MAGRHGLSRLGAAALAAAGLLAPSPILAQTTSPAAQPAATPPPSAATAALVRPPKIPVKAFAALDLIRSARLSPDGKMLAFSTPVNGLERLMVSDPITRKALFAFNTDAKHELNWFRWAGNGKVIFSIASTDMFEGEEVRFTRLFVADVATGKSTYVGPRQAGILGDDVLYVDPDGQFALIAIQRSIYDWPSVWRFPLDETAQKAGKEIQKPIDGAWDWYADDKGNVRMAVVQQGSAYRILYRARPEDPLKTTVTITKKNWEEKIWDVTRIFEGSDKGYAIERNPLGRAVVVEADYATRTTGATAYALPDADITDYDLDDNNKLRAVYYSNDTDRVVWIDPKMKSLQSMLNKALPGSAVWIGSRSKDNTRMIVWQSHEGDPGAMYMFDTTTRRLELLANMRPDLNPADLSRPKPIDYQARDKVQIRAYLTLPRGREAKGLPLVILPHGGPYWVRDKLEYNDEVQFLANRGYAVLQPNFRGSEGYGEGFAGLGEGQIGRAMQDDLDDGMDHLVREGIVDAKRVCMVGASYGGYASAWGAIRNPERYRCAASFAGVMNWQRQVNYANRYESDPKEKRKWSRQVRGGADGEFNVDLVSPAKQVARLSRPLLLVHGDKDTRVPFSQFKEMRDAATKAGVPIEQLVMPGVGHGFDKVEDTEKWFTTLEAFLARHNPAD